MSRVEVALIKPSSPKRIYGRLSNFELTAIEPRLWGAILAGPRSKKDASSNSLISFE